MLLLDEVIPNGRDGNGLKVKGGNFVDCVGVHIQPLLAKK